MKFLRADWTTLAIALAVAALLLHCCQSGAMGAEPTTQPTTRPFAIESNRGRLELRTLDDNTTDAGCWSYPQWVCDGEGCRWSDYNAPGYFDGYLIVCADDDRLQIEAGTQNPKEFSPCRFVFRQDAGQVEIEFTIRTPVNQPDATYVFVDRDLPALFRVCPGLRGMLDGVLAGLGQPPYSDDDALDPRETVQPEIATRVAELIADADSPEFAVREAAVAELIDMGRDGALALLAADRTGWTAAEQIAAGRVLAGWPVVERAK